MEKMNEGQINFSFDQFALQSTITVFIGSDKNWIISSNDQKSRNKHVGETLTIFYSVQKRIFPCFREDDL